MPDGGPGVILGSVDDSKVRQERLHITQTLHGTATNAYIDPQNHPN